MSSENTMRLCHNQVLLPDTTYWCWCHDVLSHQDVNAITFTVNKDLLLVTTSEMCKADSWGSDKACTLTLLSSSLSPASSGCAS